MAETAEAAAVAADPSAPAPERYDAQVALAKAYAPRAMRDLIPAAEVQPVIDYINDAWEEAEFRKSMPGNIIKFPSKTKPGMRGPQSVLLDDYQLIAQGQYWDRPGLLSFDSLRAMVDQTPILNAIVMTRIRQVMRFCSVQSKGVGPGFAIAHVDKTVELDDQQQKSVKLLEGFMTNCGWESDPRKRKKAKRDNLSQFMAKIVRDSLTMDSAPIETEFKRDANLGIDGFYAIDGATVRLCTEHGYEGDDEIFALQVIQGNVRCAYNYDELIYEVRNPRTDVTACGYGLSETETLIRVVTWMLNAMTYNGSYFDKNSIPRGILHLSGNYSTEDLQAFKRYWAAMVRGVENTWNVPVLVSKDQESKAAFEALNGQLDEMAFSKWLVFLVSVACAIYGISPEEISMESFSAGKSALSGGDTEEKLASGIDKGLRPLLSYIENVFSDFVIRTFSDQYCLRFTGLDEDDPKQQFELRKMVLKVNEARSQLGYDPDDSPLGDAPLNPTLLGPWQALQQQMQGDFGNPDAPGPGDGAQAPEQGQGEGFGKPPAAGAPDFGGGQPAPAPAGQDMGKAFGLPDLTIYAIEP